MEYSNMKAVVDESLAFPATHSAVINQVGAVEITSPSGDSITVKEILNPVAVDTYDSSDDLYMTIIGNLGDSFIGRKYYDDRGGNPTPSDAGDSQVSF
jgi:hypothetical protein